MHQTLPAYTYLPTYLPSKYYGKTCIPMHRAGTTPPPQTHTPSSDERASEAGFSPLANADAAEVEGATEGACARSVGGDMVQRGYIPCTLVHTCVDAVIKNQGP